MTQQILIGRRVLAIDPTHRGFGYVVFEGPEFLVDWGVRSVHSPKNPRCAESAARLIDLYRPDVLILEDASATGCRRQARVRGLLDELVTLARQRGVRVHRVSRQNVRKTFASQGASNKYRIARVIATRFPELTPHLPPERKPWMSEDQRMAMFDAAAFALAFFLASKASEQDEKTDIGHRSETGEGSSNCIAQ